MKSRKRIFENNNSSVALADLEDSSIALADLNVACDRLVNSSFRRLLAYSNSKIHYLSLLAY